MERKLNKKKRIEEIMKLRGVQLSDEFSQNTDILSLSRETRMRIVEELTMELIQKGLLPDSEPNEYGIEIEGLIDCCGLAAEDIG